MKIRVIADHNGTIKAFAIRPANYDPKKGGEIFPTAGHIAHDLAMPPEHQQLFLKEPRKVPGALRVSVVAGKSIFIPHHQEK